MKKLFILLVGTSAWLYILIGISTWFSVEGRQGESLFIASYIIISFLIYFRFTKIDKFAENISDKSTTPAVEIDIKAILQLILYFGVAVVIIALIVFGISSISRNRQKLESDAYYKGDMSNTGGTPTYRYSDTPSYSDKYYTTDDESNNQAVGFYGTDTMYACNGSSGNCYDLDVDSDGENIERLYFEKGGWVDIDYSDCEDGFCYVEDENGNEWELEAY
jgi:hypothetical protein